MGFFCLYLVQVRLSQSYGMSAVNVMNNSCRQKKLYLAYLHLGVFRSNFRVISIFWRQDSSVFNITHTSVLHCMSP